MNVQRAVADPLVLCALERGRNNQVAVNRLFESELARVLGGLLTAFGATRWVDTIRKVVPVYKASLRAGARPTSGYRPRPNLRLRPPSVARTTQLRARPLRVTRTRKMRPGALATVCSPGSAARTAASDEIGFDIGGPLSGPIEVIYTNTP